MSSAACCLALVGKQIDAGTFVGFALPLDMRTGKIFVILDGSENRHRATQGCRLLADMVLVHAEASFTLTWFEQV